MDFTDRFERPDGAVGGWSLYSGQWDIRGGELHTAVAEGWLWAGAPAISFEGDYEIAANVAFPFTPGDEVGRHGGVMFFAGTATQRNGNTGYTLDWIDRASDHGFRLIRWDGGSFQILVGGTPAIAAPPGLWEIAVTGDEIIVRGDGNTVIDVVDGTYRSGHFGVWSYSNSEILFDNVELVSGARGIRACFSATPRVGEAPLEVDFDASCSAGSDTEAIVAYDWTFGDGAVASGPAVTHTYDTVGRYPATLTVNGAAGTTVSTAQSVDVLEVVTPPVDVDRLLSARVKRYGAEADSVVVFNEIMYHPRSNEDALEWLELHNQMAVDVDVSDWLIGDGVIYEIPAGTVIPSGGFLVIARDPAALEAATGFAAALGPFAGRLDNDGERLALFNKSGRRMDGMRFSDRDDWPVAPDGSGLSLAKIDPLSASGPAANWAPSAQRGGTPGSPNFPAAAPAPPPGATTAALAFNEFELTPDDYWLEILNHGTQTVELAGFSIALGSSAAFVFTNGLLVPGEHRALSRSDLGFDVELGESLFLHPPGGLDVIDAVKLLDGNRGRHPAGSGPWLVPEAATPGSANSFRFEDAIVINEIHYHPRLEPAAPDVVAETVLVAVDGVWRYDQSGLDRGTAWRAPEFDDGAWPADRAVFFNENGNLPAPKNTELVLGATTFYFRTSFDIAGPLAGEVEIRLLVDDGAVVYLNGVEVLRENMPSGPLTAATLAETGVSDAAFSGPFTLPADRLRTGRNVLAVEVHQATAASSDVVFAAELAATVVLEPGHPAREPPESWLELHNRSAEPVDLAGWRFARGIDFVFAPGTVIAPGGYLVVAEDRQTLRAKYPAVPIVGDFTGTLANGSDRLVLADARGNPADVVEYFDGGRWPAFADGGGSSLELRDVAADNAKGEAWAASDESDGIGWRTYSYREVATANFGPTQWREFVVGLLDAGEILVDDLSVVREPDGTRTQLLQNGDFENGAASWRFLGNHRHTAVIDDPEQPGNQVLHVVATGPTEHMHNHLETTLADNQAAPNGVEYEVSFRARWLTGSNQLNTRLYFNRVPRTTLVEVPQRAGTPGARNSTFEENIGPTFDRLRHAPVVPQAGEIVSVSVRAADPDGVERVTLWWSANEGAWQSAPLALEPDAPPTGDGELYSGLIPGESASRIVQFYVEAEDSRGAASTFPAGGRDARALYKVEDGQARDGVIHDFRIIMTNADASLLHQETNVMSNERLGATVIYREEESFYDVGCRLKGSQRGRPGGSRVSFTVRFHPDALFRGAHRTVSLDRSGGWGIGAGPTGQDEIVIKHAINQAGLPGMYDDIAWLVAPRSAQNGPTLVMMAKYSDVFTDNQYPGDSDGTAYKVELIYYPTTTVTGDPEALKLPQPDVVVGTDLRDLGDDKELYRWTFLLENNADRDDYSRFIQLCKAMSTSGPSFGPRMEELLDIDEATRMYAVHTLCGISDTYWFAANFHNVVFLELPLEERFVVLGWDNDVAFTRATNAAFWGGPNLARLYAIPEYERLFYGHLHDIVEDFFNLAYMQRWTSHYGELAQETGSFNVVRNYIAARSDFVRNSLPAQVPFAITTNNGADFVVDALSATIEGTAWIDVRSIAIAGFATRPDLAWASRDRWQTNVPLVPGENNLTFLAFGYDGFLAASDTITVSSTAELPAPVLASVEPDEAAAGETVTLRGGSFYPGIDVLFGDVAAATATPLDSITLTAVVPNLAPGVVSLSVRNVDGKTSGSLPFRVVDPGDRFVRGDINRDGFVDIGDPVATLFYLYFDHALSCLDAADANDDEEIDLTDVLLLLDFLFLDGAAPSAPFPFPGTDSSGAGGLGCGG